MDTTSTTDRTAAAPHRDSSINALILEHIQHLQVLTLEAPALAQEIVRRTKILAQQVGDTCRAPIAPQYMHALDLLRAGLQQQANLIAAAKKAPAKADLQIVRRTHTGRP